MDAGFIAFLAMLCGYFAFSSAWGAILAIALFIGVVVDEMQDKKKDGGDVIIKAVVFLVLIAIGFGIGYVYH